MLNLHERFGHGSRGRRPLVTILRLGPHPHGFFHSVGIQQREGCTTVLAFGSHLKIDGGTAMRTVHLPHLRSDPLHFRRCQAANELLLTQELQEWRKPPIAPRAPKIGKSIRLCHVITQ
jgi:hypothetical protein